MDENNPFSEQKKIPLSQIVPMAPFTPKSNTKLRSALHFRYKNKKNDNTFILEKKCNIIIIFIKYVIYNSFLKTVIVGTAASRVVY